MRHRQARLVDRLVAVEQQVEIDRPRPPALAALAPELALDREQRVEQLARRQLGLERGGAVQERAAGRRRRPDRSRAAARRRRRREARPTAASIVASRSPRFAPESRRRPASRSRRTDGCVLDLRIEHDLRLAHSHGDVLATGKPPQQPVGEGCREALEQVVRLRVRDLADQLDDVAVVDGIGQPSELPASPTLQLDVDDEPLSLLAAPSPARRGGRRARSPPAR